ncbi:unnamed protein product [Brassica oleracea var. botrytis]
MEKPPGKVKNGFGRRNIRWPIDQPGFEIDQSENHSFLEERLKDSVVELPQRLSFVASIKSVLRAFAARDNKKSDHSQASSSFGY